MLRTLLVAVFSQEGLDAIQEMMETAIADGRISAGIAMVARDGKIAWLGTAGEMAPGIPMRDDAIMPLASVGKMFTATAAMILVERGVISLDDPVSKYIPEFADVMVGVTDEDGARSKLVAPENPDHGLSPPDPYRGFDRDRRRILGRLGHPHGKHDHDPLRPRARRNAALRATRHAQFRYGQNRRLV